MLFAVGAASQGWSNELIMVKCSLMMDDILSIDGEMLDNDEMSV